jgi:hypothetical protein
LCWFSGAFTTAESLFVSGLFHAAALVVAGEAQAQFVQFAPAPVFVSQPMVVHHPVMPVTHFSPVVVGSPVFVGRPVVTTTTRYRPFLGRRVTRVHHGFAPTPVFMPAW